jgi:hypothetical protein
MNEQDHLQLQPSQYKIMYIGEDSNEFNGSKICHKLTKYQIQERNPNGFGQGFNCAPERSSHRELKK